MTRASGERREAQVTDEYFSSFLYQKVAPQILEFTPKGVRASHPESGLSHPSSRVSKPHGQTQEIPCFSVVNDHLMCNALSLSSSFDLHVNPRKHFLMDCAD